LISKICAANLFNLHDRFRESAPATSWISAVAEFGHLTPPNLVDRLDRFRQFGAPNFAVDFVDLLRVRIVS
jgi:hypothetical protein